MIAPIRQPRPKTQPRAAGLSAARRAVARALLSPSVRTEATVPRIPAWLGWALVGWTVAIAASFLGFSAWWALEAY
jgi:hypothetical protein